MFTAVASWVPDIPMMASAAMVTTAALIAVVKATVVVTEEAMVVAAPTSMRSYTEELSPVPRVDTAISAGAEFGIRFLARGIDTLYWLLLDFVTAFCASFGFAALSSVGVLPANWYEGLQQTSPWAIVLRLVSLVAYHTVAEGIGGTSLGKVMCGLNVVRLDGRPCGLVAAFKRSLLYYFDGLFFGAVAYQSMKESALQQRYGDGWAKTVVVRKSVFTPTPEHPAWRLVLAIAAGSAAAIALQFTEMLLNVL